MGSEGRLGVRLSYTGVLGDSKVELQCVMNDARHEMTARPMHESCCGYGQKVSPHEVDVPQQLDSCIYAYAFFTTLFFCCGFFFPLLIVALTNFFSLIFFVLTRHA